ncbi:hypothetical protein [Cohnella abietis]|uniref:Lipoprotein n=1 Tax=Cohnella abietis TaxID=2507935 RepID=A0A3T1DED2_9BACL|nr:hypothetical protein [Cohnella abietis]BBI36490.1 hypothetical protein KCTCHS21_58890 [Cohnella abietis]
MKKAIPLIVLAAGLTLLISSCSDNSGKAESTSTITNAVENIQATQASVTAVLEEKLPAPYTLANIKNAMEEYINYRLWLYPSKVELNASPKSFDPYIGKTIGVEVRVYESSSGEKRVYAQTSIGDWWLTEFKTSNGIVYSDNQVSKEDTGLWPEGNYEVAGTFELKVQEPHKPNYGASARKDKMIAAAENHLKNVCNDLLRGEEGEIWSGTTAYLENFYEYEEVVSTWLVRPDGYLWSSGVSLSEENGKFNATGIKGFAIDDINKLDKYDLTRYGFDRGTQDAVRQLTCNGDDQIQ